MDRELVVSHLDMNAAYRRGDAVPLTESVLWLTRYQDDWWVVYEGGWLRITEDLTAADIAQHRDQPVLTVLHAGAPPPASC